MQSGAVRLAGIGGFFVSSYSLLLLTWGSYNVHVGNAALALTASILFWVGLLTGVGGCVLLCRTAARRARDDLSSAGKEYAAARSGLLTFGSSRAALTAELALAVSAVAELLCALQVLSLPAWGEYFFIATIIFCFEMHCLLNGRAYIYSKHASQTERTRAER